MRVNLKTSALSALLATVLFMSLTACGTNSTASVPQDNSPQISATQVPTAQDDNLIDASVPEETTQQMIITDLAGDEVELPGKVAKIACTWPSGTQLFITLGMSDLLIAVPADSKEQPWAMHIAPDVMNLEECGNDLSAEQFLNIGADIIITTEADVARELRSKNIKAITVNYYSVDEMREAITLIASIIPKPYEARCYNYLNYLDDQIGRVQAALNGKITKKASIYYINGNNNKGLYKTAGGGTMNEAWAKYAFTDFITSSLLSSSETNVDAEAVLAANPDYVVIGGRYQRVLYDELLAAEEWKDIEAVKNGNVITAPLGVSPFDRFGAEFAMMIPWLASQVYSDMFDYNATTEIQNFYKSFSDYEMSQSEAEYIIEALMPDGTREISNE